MKNNILSTLAFLFVASGLFAQLQIERQVIATSGHFGDTGSHLVSSTVGEVATASYLAGNFHLTQGFQQSEDIVSSTDDVTLKVDFKFYPNPTSGEAFLELNMPMAADLNFDILDVAGRNLGQMERQVNEGFFKQEFDLHHLSPGAYFLRIQNEDAELLQSIKFMKIR